MTGDEKTNYLRIGLGLSGVVVNNMTAEIIWRTVEGLQKKKGKFSVSDSVEIEMLVKGKLEKKRISLEENSKKSEKISESKKRNISNIVPKYDFSCTGNTPSICFRNRVGKQCSLMRRMENNGKSIVLLVSGDFVLINQSQKTKFGNLIEKYGFNSDAVYDLAYSISNDFTKYYDADGKLVSVHKKISK